MSNYKEPNVFSDEIYTPLTRARAIIEERFSNEELKEKVLSFLGNDIPEPLCGRPKAVLSRPVATPNLEFNYFLDVAKETKLEPLVLEYHDKFISMNPVKYHLGKVCVLDKSKGRSDCYASYSPVNFNEWEGKGLGEVMTKKNRSIIDEHHGFLYAIYPEMEQKVYNFTEWFQAHRGKTDEDYYVAFLALFTCFGILFENYLIDDEKERDFVLRKVVPSFKKVEELFGVKPIICPLLPLSTERYNEWHWYDKEHDALVREHFHGI